jgi:hypothetical protein
LLFFVGVPAATRPLPLVTSEPTPPPLRENKIAPVRRFMWRELDLQRVNQGTLGRKNATRDEQRVAETPSLQPRPLSSW